MAGTHDKIIADAAKYALGPLGHLRKGRTRTWIADHGWWATVVEFQPSSWSKGSYLNVAAHWLWSREQHLSFDFGGRLHEHVQYQSDQQFAIAAAALAQKAAAEAERLSRLFVSIEATAAILLENARDMRDHGWPAYNAGVAAGLAGKPSEASEMFARVTNGIAAPNSALGQAASRMAALVSCAQGLRSEVNLLIASHRAALKLHANSVDLF